MINASALQVIPIHNSDQESFLSCRRKWDITSILRQAYRPVDMPKPLRFGICMHQGWEALYDPRWWSADRDTVYYLSVSAFIDAMQKVRDKYLKDTNAEFLDDQHAAEYMELMVLGKEMLKVYYDYAVRWDGEVGWTPLGVEEEWEVPLGFSVDGVDVVFRWRTDVRMQDRYGDQWLWDHKTTARMSESVDFLTLDPQMGKYLWGLLELGYPVVGAIYNEQYKGFPDTPKVLSTPRLGRTLSVSKSQDTTYDLFMKAIEQQGEDPAMYEEYLHWLQTSSEVKQWIRRTEIRRNKFEIEQQGKTMVEIAAEMLDNPRVYPSPSRFKCDWCMVKPVCLQMNDGSDWEWTLNNQYHKVKDHYGHAV